MTETSAIVSSLIGLVPGAFGGVCNVFAGYPIDMVKVRMQTSATAGATATAAIAATRASPATSTYGALCKIFVNEGGVAGLYRGVTAPLMAVTPAFALTFWVYDLAKKQLATSDGLLGIPQIAFCGAATAVPTALVLGPTERLKVLLQIEGNEKGKKKFHGSIDCARYLFRTGGLRSLFKGSLVTMLRDLPGNAAYFAVYEYTKRTLMLAAEQKNPASGTPPSLSTALLAGGIAGVVNWIVALPMDVIKSRYQSAPEGHYRSLWHVYTSLIQKEGYFALYRGLSPALLRAFPANAATLAGFEVATEFLHALKLQ